MIGTSAPEATCASVRKSGSEVIPSPAIAAATSAQPLLDESPARIHGNHLVAINETPDFRVLADCRMARDFFRSLRLSMGMDIGRARNQLAEYGPNLPRESVADNRFRKTESPRSGCHAACIGHLNKYV